MTGGGACVVVAGGGACVVDAGVGACVVAGPCVVVPFAWQVIELTTSCTTNPPILDENQPHSRTFVCLFRGHLHFAEKLFGVFPFERPIIFCPVGHLYLQRVLFFLFKVQDFVRPPTGSSWVSQVWQPESCVFQKNPFEALFLHLTRRRPIGMYPGVQI